MAFIAALASAAALSVLLGRPTICLSLVIPPGRLWPTDSPKLRTMKPRPPTAAASALLMAPSAAGGSSGGAPGPNRLLSVPRLRHVYTALRHGQSLANVEGIISSDPAVATARHGLSDTGMDQARSAGERIAADFLAGGRQRQPPRYRGVAIYSSDFTRARDTARLVADALAERSVPLYGGDVILETRLRERNFGDLNGGPDERYGDVWEVDARDANHTEFGVESVNSVLARTTGLVLEIDEELSGASGGDAVPPAIDDVDDLPWRCVLVAHGDVLQIMQTGFRRMDGSLHRTLPHLETAMERELVLADPFCSRHAL